MAVDLRGQLHRGAGFVDVHIHGCAGADTCDATREALEAMAGFPAGPRGDFLLPHYHDPPAGRPSRRRCWPPRI